MIDLFIDSANIKLIKELYKLSIFKGITTTPTFFYKEGNYDFENEIKKINKIVNGEIHIEALGKDKNEIVNIAKHNNSLGNNIVAKIPINKESIQAVKILKKQKIKTNIHLIFSLNQAILAAEAGADYICPLLGRMNDIGANGFNLLKDIINVFKYYKFPTKIMASSIRSPEDVIKSIKLGIDAITIPPDIINMMFKHPLTNIGTETFMQSIQLSKKIKDIMKTSKEMPIVKENYTLYKTLITMTEKKIGIGIIINEKNILTGIITDGDIRRTIINSKDSINKKVTDVMNKNPITVNSETYISEALEIMENNRITTLIIVNDLYIPIGFLGIHDIFEPFKHKIV
jgi:TalC/MipB family fructose-6-phosphate aldolase